LSAQIRKLTPNPRSSRGKDHCAKEDGEDVLGVDLREEEEENHGGGSATFARARAWLAKLRRRRKLAT